MTVCTMAIPNVFITSQIEEYPPTSHFRPYAVDVKASVISTLSQGRSVSDAVLPSVSLLVCGRTWYSVRLLMILIINTWGVVINTSVTLSVFQFLNENTSTYYGTRGFVLVVDVVCTQNSNICRYFKNRQSLAVPLFNGPVLFRVWHSCAGSCSCCCLLTFTFIDRLVIVSASKLTSCHLNKKLVESLLPFMHHDT